MDATHLRIDVPIRRHENRDADIRRVVYFAIVLIIVIVLVAWLCFWLFQALPGPQNKFGPPAAALGPSRVLPPEPRLQVDAQLDLKKFRECEDAVLDSYGWVDKNEGIVRIPIKRAMDLLAQRGLPNFSLPAPKPAGK